MTKNEFIVFNRINKWILHDDEVLNAYVSAQDKASNGASQACFLLYGSVFTELGKSFGTLGYATGQ